MSYFCRKTYSLNKQNSGKTLTFKFSKTFAPISLKCDLALRKSSSDFGLSIVTVNVWDVCSFSLTGECSNISTNSSPFVSHSGSQSTLTPCNNCRTCKACLIVEATLKKQCDLTARNNRIFYTNFIYLALDDINAIICNLPTFLRQRPSTATGLRSRETNETNCTEKVA
uniref:Uncharacterized protein n=1 Tax=Glossina pallidipes TaxID=7398 RepID=A0A1A9ZQ09_GLOPL